MTLELILPILYLFITTSFVLLMIFGQLIVGDVILNVKFRAYYSLIMTIVLFCYVLLSLILAIVSFFNADYISFCLFFSFFLSPFIIGFFCSYKKIALFSLAQIGVLIINITYLFWRY